MPNTFTFEDYTPDEIATIGVEALRSDDYRLADEDLYRRIAAEAGEHLNPGGYLYLEVGIGEAEPVLEMVTKNIQCAQAGVLNDLCGIPRIVWARSV